MTKLFTKTLLCLLLLLSSGLSQATTLVNMRIADGLDSQRVVLTFDKAVKYKVFSLHNPERFIVDLSQTSLQKPLSKLSFVELPIKGIRKAVRNRHDLRLVFDLTKRVKPRVFTLGPQERYGHRLVLDFPIPLAKNSQVKIKSAQPKVTIPRRAKLRDVVVVIDPGHGGKDPGATGHRGTHEKKVVMAIAKTLKRIIDKQVGMKAVLTRQGDYYVGLRKRLNLARKANADIFVAIHADAFLKPSSHGASVFALSQRGASSEAARWLATRENNSELGGVDDFSDKSYLVRSVLLDLSQTSTIKSSLNLGSAMLGDLKKITKLHSKKVEQARFVVLKSPDIPSVLVETGFISNPREEANLRDPKFRTKLAYALLAGIKKYFWQHAPHGTLIAAERKANRYTVVAGDSLSRIAQRFKVSLKKLKTINRLKNSAVNTGQVLWIPRG